MKETTILERNKYWNERFQNTIYGVKSINFIDEVIKTLSMKSVLVFGGGYGRNSTVIAKHGFDVVNVDSSYNAAKIGKETYDNLEYIVGDVFTMKFSQKFDNVVSIYLISLFKENEAKRIIKNMHECLIDNGNYIVNFLALEDDEYGLGKEVEGNTFLHKDGQIIRFYSEEDIKKMYSGFGLKIDKITKVNETRNIKGKEITSTSYLVCSN